MQVVSAMAKKYTSVLGVDIGSQTIKVAEVKLQGRRPVISAYGMAQTPSGAVDHMGVHDSESVGAVLKDLITSCGATVGDVVISMAGQGSVLVRTLEVPTMSEGELKQHMEWEITRNVPFAESSVVSDFKAFPPATADAQNMDVVMAIATQSSVDTAMGTAKRAGKKTAALDVEPLALARTLSIGYDGELGGKQVCVIDIGHKTTSINIYRDGQILMPRQVPVGGELITRSLADNMGISFEDAESMKLSSAKLPASVPSIANPFDSGAQATVQSYNPFAVDGDMPVAPVVEESAEVVPAAVGPSNGLDAEGARIFDAISGAMDEFVSEVRRSVDYFRSKGGDVDLILLCGGGSKMKGMKEFLKGAVGIEVDLMDPARNISVEAKKPDAALWDAGHEDFAVAIGNGLHIAF